MRDPKRINRILELLAQYWHAAPDLRLGQIVGNCTPRVKVPHWAVTLPPVDAPGDSYNVEDDIIEARLKDAIAKLDYKVLPPRHPSRCVARASGTCVWLRDGTKITVKRDADTKGRAWLGVEQQAVVHLAGEEPTATVCKTCGADPNEELEMPRDPASEWMEGHQDIVLKHQGKCIAVHPERGIVASGEKLADVFAEVERLGLKDDPDILFSAVPVVGPPEAVK